MKKSSDQYIAAIDDLAGVSHRIYEITERGDPAPILVIIYDHVPEVGHTTAFSFGLSSATHPEWRHGKPELMISVNSLEHSWGLCMGEIILRARSSSLFEYGRILHFREEVVDGCPMTSFLVFANSLLHPDEAAIELPDRKVNIVQLYPIYESEAALIQALGADRFFFDSDIDFFDISRAPAKLD